MENIYLNLEEILKERGITRYRLAKIAGVSYPVVDRYYKNNVVRYDKEILFKICKALHCEIQEIIVVILKK